MNIDETIETLLPEIIRLRHELHQHPEIRFEEHWTASRISAFLEEAGVPFKSGFAGGTGIVATLQGRPGKTLVLRADIDALELQETSGLPYASEIPNRMHACGHDGHMACLCGAAKALARHKDQLNGTVRFVFQPAEELGAGGRRMVEEGVLDGADAAFALHVWPALPVGRIGVKDGTIMASADWFCINIQGRGCHGAHPDTGIDPVIVAAHITTALQTIVSRELAPTDPGVVTVGRIQAGVASNIISESAVMEGTFRALTPKVRDAIAQAIERIALNTAAAFRASASIRFGDDCYAPLINDPAMTAFARNVISKTFGANAIVEVDTPSMGAEDFAFYLQRVPGAMLWLGNASAEGVSPMIHNPQFDFNDNAIPVAIRLWVSLATQFLA